MPNRERYGSYGENARKDIVQQDLERGTHSDSLDLRRVDTLDGELDRVRKRQRLLCKLAQAVHPATRRSIVAREEPKTAR